MTEELARRRRLIEATVETLAEVGFPAASLQEIARRAQVSTGLFAHYFGDKDGLLEATLRYMAARLAASVARRLRAATTRRERLYAIAEAALAEEEQDRETSAVWLAFWAQVAHSERYRRVQRIYERRMISNLRHALHGLVAAERVETCAALIAAGVDGLWLRARAGGAIDGERARRLARALIDGLVASPEFEYAAPSPPPASMANRRRPGRDEYWLGLGAGERAECLRACGQALRASTPRLARYESETTKRAIRATLSDAEDAARAFESAALAALALRRTRLDLGGGLIEEREPAPGGVWTGGAHWSRPLLDLGRAAFALAAGDVAHLVVDPRAAPLLGEVQALLRGAGLPPSALAASPAPPSIEAPFGLAGLKAATVVLPGANAADAARAALGGGRAWSGSSFASQTIVYVHRSMQREFVDACKAVAARMRVGDPLDPETEIGPPLSREHEEWLAALLGRKGAGPFVVEGCEPESPLARASAFAAIVAVVAFDHDDGLVEELVRRPTAPACGVFSGDRTRARRFVEALGRPLSFINAGGLGPLPWPDLDAPETRRVVWRDGGTIRHFG